MNILELPVIDKVAGWIGIGFDRLVPDRTQAAKLTISSQQEVITAEVSGPGWVEANWRGTVMLGIWGDILYRDIVGRPVDWMFWLLLGLGVLGLTGYVLTPEKIRNIALFLKTMMRFKAMKPQEQMGPPAPQQKEK